MKQRLQQIATRRHQIAHRADIPENATKVAPIRRDYVQQETDFLWRVGLAIHDDLSEYTAQF